jgi:hypothetical protein
MESNEHQPEFFREKETRRKIIQKEEKKEKGCIEIQYYPYQK